MSLGCLYLTMANQRDFFCLCEKFLMTLAATGTLETEANVKYLRKLVRKEALRRFELISADPPKKQKPD